MVALRIIFADGHRAIYADDCAVAIAILRAYVAQIRSTKP